MEKLTESYMANKFEDFLRKDAFSAFSKVLREIPMKQGIPDFVALGKPIGLDVVSTKSLYDYSFNNTAPSETSESMHVWAFELKLKNWKRALYQAFRCKSFADWVFVVLPSEKRSLALKNVDLFRSLDVGLCVFDLSSSQVEQLHVPEQNKRFFKPYREFAVDRLLAASVS
jgi:hypothetical protein